MAAHRERFGAALLLVGLTIGCGDPQPDPQPAPAETDVAPAQPAPPAPEPPEPPPPPPTFEVRATSVPPPDSTLLVVGRVRPDGAVEPEIVRTADGWTDVNEYAQEPGAWAAVPRYRAWDPDGTESTLVSSVPVQVCCSSELDEPLWAHGTRNPGDTAEFSAYEPRYGLAFSGNAPAVPFRRTESRQPSPERVQAVLDSLAPIPDSVLMTLDSLPRPGVSVSEAILEGQRLGFVQIVQLRRWQMYDWCFIVVGWLDEGTPPDIHVTSSGGDDCENKGFGRHYAEIAFREGDDTYAIVSIAQWEGSGIELWRHGSGADWTRVELAPDTVGLIPLTGN